MVPLIAFWTLLAQEPVIRLDVQHVLVPLVVTDKKGHHVPGLRSSEFRIFEDGVEQEIASFSTDTAASVDDVAALSKSSSAAGPRHTFVICIDTLHISNAARTREALENLFEKEKPADAQFVVIGIGRQLQVLQPATTNPLAILVKLRSPAFLSAVGGLDASALAAQLQNIRTRMEEFCKHCACGMRTSQRNCDSEIDTLKQSIDAEAERWIAPANALLDQFTKVVEELAKLPTGRTLILVSDGFNLDPKLEFYRVVSEYLPQVKPAESKDAESILRQALKVASERNVVIDTIDSRGSAVPSIASSGSMDASAPGRNSSDYSVLGSNRSRSDKPAAPINTSGSKTNRLQLDLSPEMEQLARVTGGVYFHDSQDLLKQFRAALSDGRQYYVLSYTPRNSAHDGKFRNITVEIKDTKLSVRAKSGYWAAQ
ncbi:MAG TPA: VWA domain-containing protein [Bryobacteraceae bacterium]|jgi:VWFA-related protein|nr:VWA domain-containing protein [Bryobacteraceae bacterium]